MAKKKDGARRMIYVRNDLWHYLKIKAAKERRTMGNTMEIILEEARAGEDIQEVPAA